MSNTKNTDSGAAEGARRATEQPPESARAGAGRWSSRRKTAVILELLRGADLESTSRKYRVTVATLSDWRDRFLAAGEAGIKSREVNIEDEEKRRLKSVVAGLSVEAELLREKIALIEGGRPLVSWKSRTCSRTVSASSNKPYGVARVVAIWDVPRSSFYAARQLRQNPREPRKRGPKVLYDPDLLAAIRTVLDEAVFMGEGYRKVWARLRHKGIRTSKARVNRLMRENQWLSPYRQLAPVTQHPHDGIIITDQPDQMWGTDATATFTAAEGAVTVFAAIDHCTAECIGIHAVKKATRFEALEPVRQGVREHFGSFSRGSAAGLLLRHDHGSVYMSDDFQNEIRFLGIESSPAFVRQPEGNGCIERFFRTLKEQLLWIHHFRDLDELQTALVEFRDRYNQQWIIGRLGYRTPAQARRDFELALPTAA